MIRKDIFKGIISLMLILIISVTIISYEQNSNAKIVQAAEKGEVRSIEITGEGTMKVSPDKGIVSIGVETQNKNTKKAQQSNKEKMNTVIDSIKKLGIKDENIKTIEYTIRPIRNYNKEEGKSNITGYIVRNVIEVSINDLEVIGEVIDKASENGANNIRNIRFTLKDKESYYNEALKRAIKTAENKAKALSETIGVNIDKPVKIVEISNYNYPVNNMYESKVSYDAEESRETPVEKGELTITAKVRVIYDY